MTVRWPLVRRRAAGDDESVNELAEALRSARAAWDDAARDPGAACGTDVVEQAYTTMQATWFAELGVHLQVLDDGQ